MNRLLTRNYQTFINNPVNLFGRIAIGSTGAPTVNALQSQGILSITRTGTGAYTIAFGGPVGVDTYKRLLSFGFNIVIASGDTVASAAVVADNSTSLTAPGINVVFRDASLAAVDPASGSDLRLSIVLIN